MTAIPTDHDLAAPPVDTTHDELAAVRAAVTSINECLSASQAFVDVLQARVGEFQGVACMFPTIELWDYVNDEQVTFWFDPADAEREFIAEVSFWQHRELSKVVEARDE